VYQERSVGDVTSANPYGGQGVSADSTTRDPDVSLRTLDWIGRHAFTARYAVRPVVDRILGTGWGPRRDQSVSHHLATVESPTGLVYAYDLTWDEYAVLAIDVPRAAVETALGRARTGEAPLTVEVFAGLLTDNLPAPSLAAQTSAEWTTGVEL